MIQTSTFSVRRRLAPALLLLAAAGLPAQTAAPEPSERFATVGDLSVSYGELYTALLDYAGIEVAERLLMEVLIQREAARQNLAPTAAEIDQRVREIMDERFGGNAARFSAWMAETGSDTAAVRRRVATELMDFKLRSQDVEVTDEALRAYFTSRRAERYDLPETVRYRQIVFDSEAKVNEILGQIKAGALDFFTAASRHSLDPSAVETGGLVGPQSVPLLARLAPPVAEALAGLSPNESTPLPVEFEGRWYLLLLVERGAGREVTYEEVAERVRRDFVLERAIPEEQFYRQLVEGAKVTVEPERFRILELGFGPPKLDGPVPPVE